MSRKLVAAVILSILFITALPVQIREARGDSTTPVVNRIFYLTGTSQRTLSLQRPSAGFSSSVNTTGAIEEFVDLASVRSFPTVTISAPMNLSLWIKSDRNSTLSMTGTLAEKLGSTSAIILNATVPQPLTRGLRPYNFTLPTILTQPIVPGAQLAVSVKLTWLPKANVTLFWGSALTPSSAILRLSGYASFKGSVEVRDRQAPTTRFDLNSSFPNNIAYFEVTVASAFGIDNILKVNMTLVDPSLNPVRAATNQEMRPFDSGQPEVRTGFWVYSSNATAGVYQVYIDIIDIQNATAFRFRGPATFELFRAGFLSRPPFNYLPYAGIGGVVVIGGALYYRRRRTKKSYLVPFDYFNTLIGGELDGGTVVSVEGNTGAGKTLLSEQLMFEDLKKGRPCVFVATGDFPSNIRANMKAMGLDITGYEQSGIVTFVDGYSAEAGQESREKFAIPSLGDLTNLGIKISSSLPPESFKGGSLYFDSLTPLASKTKPDSIVSFVQSLGARVKGMGGKAFFTVGPSVDGKVQRQLEEMADCVVQMEAFEEGGARKSRLRISKYRARRYQQGWVLYTIEEGKGMIFYSKKPRQ